MSKRRWPRLAASMALALLLPCCGSSGEVEAPYAKQLSEEFARIAEKVSPAVVHVATVRVIRRGGEGGALPELFDDPFFERFFRRFPTPEGEFRQRGLGSGVIVSEDGYILTNNHVVANATELKVQLNDQREFDAKVVGTDPETDIAVLKVDGEDLPTATLGDSDALEVGHIVLAIGSPFGLDRTLTFGIISAKGRANVGITEFEDFIQTDAAINPGNSGGPMVNLEGEVVGINTAIFSRSGGHMGIGFAIPINMATAVMKSIREKGRVIRGYLGVGIQNLTPELAKALGMEHREGALVSHVVPDTPAAEAGLQRGDLIIAVGDHEVESATSLRNRVARMSPGQGVQLTILRDGEKRQIKVTLGERPEQGTQPEVAQRQLGFEVRELTERLRERYDIEAKHGVLVVSVRRGSKAYTAGLRPGAVILEVNRRPVRSVADFRTAIGKVEPGENILLLVSYRGMTSYIVVQAEE
ncbi:MAG: DegQ family serine endoprotease [bacterium]